MRSFENERRGRGEGESLKLAELARAQPRNTARNTTHTQDRRYDWVTAIASRACSCRLVKNQLSINPRVKVWKEMVADRRHATSTWQNWAREQRLVCGSKEELGPGGAQRTAHGQHQAQVECEDVSADRRTRDKERAFGGMLRRQACFSASRRLKRRHRARSLLQSVFPKPAAPDNSRQLRAPWSPPCAQEKLPSSMPASVMYFFTCLPFHRHVAVRCPRIPRLLASVGSRSRRITDGTVQVSVGVLGSSEQVLHTPPSAAPLPLQMLPAAGASQQPTSR